MQPPASNLPPSGEIEGQKHTGMPHLPDTQRFFRTFHTCSHGHCRDHSNETKV